MGVTVHLTLGTSIGGFEHSSAHNRHLNVQDCAHWAKGDIWQSYQRLHAYVECIRGPSNHWVLAKVTPTGIGFMQWDLDTAMREDIVVLCGEGCAAALLSRSLSEWIP